MEEFHRSKEVLKKIAPENTEQISVQDRIGQFTSKKPMLLKVNAGSAEKKMYM